MRKSIFVILNQPNIKNNKIDKDNFKKNHNKKNHVGEHYSNLQCLKKKTTKLNSLPAQYEKNKINKDNSEKKQKNHKKNHAGKHCSIPQYFF
jgi:hypothetical protein